VGKIVNWLLRMFFAGVAIWGYCGAVLNFPN